jgi:hypothetical protein
MRYRDNGSLFSVNVSAQEVARFKNGYPCSGLPTKAFWFQFDKRNGDLVDVSPSNVDGPAVLALSQDAQAYGLSKLSN